MGVFVVIICILTIWIGAAIAVPWLVIPLTIMSFLGCFR